MKISLDGTYRMLSWWMRCFVILHHSTRIFVHGVINFHTIMLVTSLKTLVVHFKAHLMYIREAHFVPLNVPTVSHWHSVFLTLQKIVHTTSHLLNVLTYSHHLFNLVTSIHWEEHFNTDNLLVYIPHLCIHKTTTSISFLNNITQTRLLGEIY